jgi:hypothetical protein
LQRERELQRINQTYGLEPAERWLGLMERQFQLLHNRAQVLLGLCGVVITTTGFSGRLIAGTHLASQILIIVGLSLTLASSLTIVLGVLPLRWITQLEGADPEAWLRTCLTYRDRKTSHYRWAIWLLIVGLAFYVLAIAIMLLLPEEFQPRPGR